MAKRNGPDPAAWAAYMRDWRRRNPEKRATNNARVLALRRERRLVPTLQTHDRQRESTRKRNQYRDDPTYRAATIALAKATYQRVRGTVVAAYGSVCACCGELEPLFLELDHVHGGGNKDFRRKGGPVSFYRQIVARGFPDEYRLLCANCNKGRQRNGGFCPHGHGI